ncbi:MAG: peptidase T [Prevotellaceae bacterium]|nr:peptidase T [Prevotellaceae bacterium]
MESVREKFLRYVTYDTRSDESSATRPSTPKQTVLLNQLAGELKALGLADVSLDNGNVTATFPSNIDSCGGRRIPVVGFLAHVDTSPEMSGEGVNPRITENYGGGDIVLNEAQNIVLRADDFPELGNYVGQTIITTDGNTLLGADDKAGIAEIMYTMQYLAAHPEIPHGTLKIAFTSDEEIGRGADGFDVAKFGADFAYTFDGGAVGELEYENFNAATAKITVKGRNIHTGYAKNRMTNAALAAMELAAMLPPAQRPEHTEGYEGFFHLAKIAGEVEHAELTFLIRDHDSAEFERRKTLLANCVSLLNSRYGDGALHLEIRDSYRNMKEKILPCFHVVETARRAMEKAGVVPVIKPIRGGTDGARLSFMGLPCPNIFAGGHNFHGRYEFVPVESMEKACAVMLNIIELYAE